MNNKIVRIIPLPLAIKAFTSIDSNGDYNIYINDNLARCEQEDALRHEELHIERDDFNGNGSIGIIEMELHK